MDNSWVLNFANTIVGVGVLAIPFCFHICGIGMAVLMVLATNILTRKTCEYMLKAGQLTRKTGYETLAQHHLGSAGKLITELGIIGLMLGTLISFQVVIGDLAPVLISNALGIPETWSLRTFLMCLSSVGVVPLALMRNISSLANMNAMSMGFYCIFIGVVFLMSLKNLFSGLWSLHVNFWRPEGFFHCLPIISLSFSCQTQVFVMYEAIPEQSVNIMMGIINKAIHLVTIMYLSVGIFGYIAFYETGIRGDVLANFPSGLLSDTIKSGFWVSIIVSFPLIIFPLRMSLHSLLFSHKKSEQQLVSSAADYIPQNRFTAITVFIIAGTLVVGILVPHIETVLSITGAVIGTFLCFVFPAALYILSTSKEGSSRTVAKVVFVISVICMVSSTLAVLSASDAHAQTEHKEHPGHEKSLDGVHPSVRLAKPFQMPGEMGIKGLDKGAAANDFVVDNVKKDNERRQEPKKPAEDVYKAKKKEENEMEKKVDLIPVESKKEVNVVDAKDKVNRGEETHEERQVNEAEVKDAEVQIEAGNKKEKAANALSHTDDISKEKDLKEGLEIKVHKKPNLAKEVELEQGKKNEKRDADEGEGNRIKSREIKNLNEVEDTIMHKKDKVKTSFDVANVSESLESVASDTLQNLVHRTEETTHRNDSKKR